MEIMKSSEIMKKARENIEKGEVQFICSAVTDVSEDFVQAGKIKKRICSLLKIKPLKTLECRYIDFNNPRWRITDKQAEFFRFLRLKLCDFLIEQYEMEGD